MTAAVIETRDWRNKGICTATGSADDHFTDVASLMEDEGLTLTEAEVAAVVAEGNAKAVCAKCPVLAKCRESALANDEEWGVWGGMGPAERSAHRTQWLEIKAAEGAAAPTIVRHADDDLRANGGASVKLARRNEACRVARDMLLQLPADWSTPQTRRDPARSRDVCLDLCYVVLNNPTLSATELGQRLGVKRDHVTGIIRNMRTTLGI